MSSDEPGEAWTYVERHRIRLSTEVNVTYYVGNYLHHRSFLEFL